MKGEVPLFGVAVLFTKHILSPASKKAQPKKKPPPKQTKPQNIKR